MYFIFVNALNCLKKFLFVVRLFKNTINKLLKIKNEQIN